MQSSNINQTNENNPQAIIVAGKMGHGKSSFIRMLVCDQVKQTIECGAQEISITNGCYAYQMSNQAKKLLNIDQKDQILLIDTPGLDSLNKNYLIIQQIKLIVHQKKCDIIGIIYIRSLSTTRQFDQEKKSSLVQFHKIFPVKKQIKNKISLFVMTHIDNEYIRKKELERKRASAIKLFTQQKIDFIANRRVEWASQSYEDQGVLKQCIQKNKELKEIYEKQWIQLGKLINESRQIKYSNIQFNKQNSLYEQAFRTKIQNLALTSKEKCKTMVSYKFQTPEIITSQILGQIGKLMVSTLTLGVTRVGLGLGLGALTVESAAIAATLVGITTAGLCVTALPLFGAAVTFLRFQRARRQKIDKSIKQSLRQNAEDIQKQELHEMAKKSVELLLLKQMIQQTYVQTTSIQFPRKQWCRIVELKEIVEEKQISLKKYQQKNGLFGLISNKNYQEGYWELNISAGRKYVVEMTFQIPTETQILKVIKSVGKQVYYDQFEDNKN